MNTKKPPAKRKKPKKPAKSEQTLFMRLVNWGGTLLIWSFIGLAVIMAYYAYDLPSLDRLEAGFEREPRVTILARDGSELSSFGGHYGRPVPLGEVPPTLVNAVIATEDRRFYRHFGLDVFGLTRAMISNVKAGRVVQGGSTVTQQLAKNVWLTPERTIKRKVQELLLALWLEKRFSKDQILELYLNRVYLGAGTYGADAAARRYFGKSVRRINLAESAMLAGLLKAPSRYSPVTDLKRARERASQVLENMVRSGYISQAQAKLARQRPAGLVAHGTRARNARYFTDWIVNRLDSFIGPVETDLVIVTTLDPGLQIAAERAIEQSLAGEGRKRRADQGALLAMTTGGAVRAMVGGRSYGKSQYNRAVSARRQSGSAFKLFVYLAGLEAGYRPSDLWVDKPINIKGWKPGNYSGRYAGQVTMRQAFAKSINTVAVQVAEKVGRAQVIDAARRMGVRGKLAPHPSLALGVADVSMLEMVTAYAAVANGGRSVLPHGINEIRDGAGNVLYRRSGGGGGRVIAASKAARLADMMGTVITEGTGRSARLGRPAAGKTGTSQEFRDAWFVGFTSDLVAGVWYGNDDASPMKKVTGGGMPARTWKQFMTTAHAGRDPAPLAASAIPLEEGAKSLWSKIVERFGGGVTVGGSKSSESSVRRDGDEVLLERR